MKIALLGTGLMGEALAKRILEAGYPLIVYNRTQSKTQNLKEHGATVALSVKEAITFAECILCVLSDAKAIEEVLFNGNQQSLEDKTIIQMGTIAPQESIEIQKKVYESGGQYLECPVLGGKKEASQGTLILMVGATDQKFQKWSELFKIFGPFPRHIGNVGKASALKLALNQLIAAHAVSFSLSLGIVEKNDISTDDFMEILRESALYAPMMDKKLSNWSSRHYAQPNFSAKHLLKDVRLIIKDAKEKGLNTSVIEAMSCILEKTLELGLGDEDYSAVFNAVNNISS